MTGVRRLVLAFAALVAGFGLWYGLSASEDGAAPSAHQVAWPRSISLRIKPHDFTFDGSERAVAVVAEAASEGDGDVTATLTMYWAVPDEPEEEGASASTERYPGDAPLHLSYALPIDEFPAGTHVRVEFEIKDLEGTTTLEGERTIALP